MKKTHNLVVDTRVNSSFSTSIPIPASASDAARVKFSLKLTHPEHAILQGVVDVAGQPTGSANPARDFTTGSGEKAELGNWRLQPGENKLRMTGLVKPAHPNAKLEFDLEWEFMQEA